MISSNDSLKLIILTRVILFFRQRFTKGRYKFLEIGMSREDFGKTSGTQNNGTSATAAQAAVPARRATRRAIKRETEGYVSPQEECESDNQSVSDPFT